MKKTTTLLFIFLTLSAFCVKGMSQESANVFGAVDKTASASGKVQGAAAAISANQAEQTREAGAYKQQISTRNTIDQKAATVGTGANIGTVEKNIYARQTRRSDVGTGENATAAVQKNRQTQRQSRRQNRQSQRQIRHQAVVKAVHPYAR